MSSAQQCYTRERATVGMAVSKNYSFRLGYLGAVLILGDFVRYCRLGKVREQRRIVFRCQKLQLARDTLR